MPVTPFTVIPDRLMDQATFDAACDSFFNQLSAVADEITEVEYAVLGATTLVEEATSAANAAINAVDVPKWVAGDFIEGAKVWSPTDGLTYRAKAVLTSTTDPHDDLDHWWLISVTNFGDATISNANFRDVGYVFLDKGNSGTATQVINVSSATHQRIKATGNFTIGFSNWPPSGNTGEVLLELAADGTGRVITFPSGTKFIKSDGGITTVFSELRITLQTANNAIDWIYFWTRDGGTTIYCKVVR